MNIRKTGKHLLSLIAALLCTGLFFVVAAVLMNGEQGSFPGLAGEEQAAERIAETHEADLKQAEALFGSPLPALKNAQASQTVLRNAEHDGISCVIAETEWNNGIRLQAVRPASGAPLLLRGDLRVKNEYTGITVNGSSCLILSGMEDSCACFSNAAVSYCVTGEKMSAEELIQILEELVW